MQRRRPVISIPLWLMAAAVSGLQAAPTPSVSGAPAYREILDKYCVTCHNQRLKTAGLMLDNADLGQVPGKAETWEKVVRKLQARAMPPQGAPRPDEATYQRVLSWLEGQLDGAAEAHPHPGRPALHRLNRAEYANAVRDLLSLDVDAASLLPPDDSAYGFDNISDALGLSPALQEHYLSAAVKIGALAVGDPHVTAGSDTYRIPQDLSQDQHIEGLPLGTIGGTQVRQNFPLDGEYVLQAKLYRTNLNIMRGLESGHQVEFTIDGRRVGAAHLGGKDDLASLFEQPTDTGAAPHSVTHVTARKHSMMVHSAGALTQPQPHASAKYVDVSGHTNLITAHWAALLPKYVLLGSV